MPAISASAPGKTILFGEHAVVYGYPAIAVPLPDLSLKVTVQMNSHEGRTRVVNQDMGQDFFLDEGKKENQYDQALDVIQRLTAVDHLPVMKLTISSNIPVASGLGSSASFAVAMAKAITAFLGFKLPIENINEIAYEIEKNQHGSPSGIDNTVAAYQQPVYFQKGLPVEFLKLPAPMSLVLADSGIRSLTREAVSQVKDLRESNPEFVLSQFRQIEKAAMEAKTMIGAGNNARTGELMLENHAYLKNLGVSLELLDQIVASAMEAGAYGAKLCGGGLGGYVVALAADGKSGDIRQAMLQAGAKSCLEATIKHSKPTQ